MTTSTRPPVVVGFDASVHAEEALQLAVQEALRLRLPLHIVHALGVRPYAELFPAGALPVDTAPWLDSAQRRLDEVADRLRESRPQLEITTCVRMSSPTVLLLDQSRNAKLLVVGARGDGGFPGLTVGSVGVQVAAHALCPVMVVRPSARPGGPVVVGVDGSPTSERAVGFAFEQAAARRTRLVALHTYMPWAYEAVPAAADLASDVGHDDEARRLVSEAVAGWSEKYPDVQTEHVVRRRQPASGLIEATVDAQLLVVGSRGRGGFKGLLLGSVSRSVLHHAACTVAIVRDTAQLS